MSGRLSLRDQQAESLRRLAFALESVPALRDHRARSAPELAAMVDALKARFPHLSGFERANLIIETKMASAMDSDEVQAKSRAAVEWCRHASTYSTRHGGKPWRYVLIPHDAVVINATLPALISKFVVESEAAQAFATTDA